MVVLRGVGVEGGDKKREGPCIYNIYIYNIMYIFRIMRSELPRQVIFFAR